MLDILCAEPEVTDRSGAQALSGVRGEIVFENVSFAHEPGRPALRNLSAQIGRGETHYDTGKVLSGFAHGIMIRTFAQENLEELAHGFIVAGDDRRPFRA